MLSENKVSIAILAKNEEATIRHVIEQCKKYGNEVFVVDGHSTDRTCEIAEELCCPVIKDKGRGKGDGIRSALAHAKEDIVVFIDADGSHEPKDIPKLVKPIQDGIAELVVASRLQGGSDEFIGDIEMLFRMIGGSTITTLINYRFNTCLSESQNGFRAINKKTGRELGLKELITSIEHEMLIKCLKQGHRVVEVPSHEYKRLGGASKINLRTVAFRYIYSCLKYCYFI